MSSKLGKVAVLLGGRSGEREVSLKSGGAVLAALQRSGVAAEAFDPAQQQLGDIGQAVFELRNVQDAGNTRFGQGTGIDFFGINNIAGNGIYTPLSPSAIAGVFRIFFISIIIIIISILFRIITIALCH